MKEIDFLNIISDILRDSEYIGDDCAYLKDLDIFITQDTLVEDVHFLLKTTSAYNLGIKAAAVNLSDLASCAAVPLYLTISLSLPEKTEGCFVREFYKGINYVCQKYKIKVVGGDLTKSEKVMISICAIGKKKSKYLAARKMALPGDIVITTGTHGDSAAGLRLLPEHNKFTAKHITPIPRIEEGLELGSICSGNFAMMDTSDGLGDALYKIAKESKVKLEIDFSKIPYTKELKDRFSEEYKKLILWGGEDFELVACIREEDYCKIDKSKFFKIGRVLENTSKGFVIIKDKDSDYLIDEEVLSQNSYKHFGE